VHEQLGQKISGNRAWKTTDLNQTAGWNVVFSGLELEQLKRSAIGLPADRDEWLTISKQQLNAPELVGRLDAIAAEINDGYGFVKINGLDISQYNQDMIYRLYWVIAICLGDVVAQNAKGEMIGAVTDLIGGAARGTDDRGYTSSDELRFHCDGGGISALFCVRQAPTGGENAVVSLLSIYNEILEHHPEHLEVLHRGFPFTNEKKRGMVRTKVLCRSLGFRPLPSGTVALRLG